ncbi:hypothetical protein LTR74_018223 [Friedmanniomyces endolithicus]|nr:hypothetical protein LTR74_018223 [Friedmanniomyces endolithicus]
MAPKVLIVLSSHEKLGDTGKKTGWYLPEFAHPYYKLEGKADLTIASPKGGAAPLDESSESRLVWRDTSGRLVIWLSNLRNA